MMWNALTKITTLFLASAAATGILADPHEHDWYRFGCSGKAHKWSVLELPYTLASTVYDLHKWDSSVRDLPIHLLHEGHEVPYNSPEWTLTFWVKAATATNDQDLFYLDQGALVITLGTDRSIQVSFPTSLGEGQVGTDGSLVSADYTFVAVQLAANFNNAGVYSAAGAVNGYDINPFTGSYIGPTSHFVHMFIPNLAGGNAGISVANANFYDRILAKDELSAMKTAGCQSCQ